MEKAVIVNAMAHRKHVIMNLTQKISLQWDRKLHGLHIHEKKSFSYK